MSIRLLLISSKKLIGKVTSQLLDKTHLIT